MYSPEFIKTLQKKLQKFFFQEIFQKFLKQISKSNINLTKKCQEPPKEQNTIPW